MADFNGSFLAASVTSAPYRSPNATFVVVGTPVAVYAQRVFSSGLGVWCAWVGVLNPTPLAAITTPNWTGSISGYGVTSRRLN